MYKFYASRNFIFWDSTNIYKVPNFLTNDNWLNFELINQQINFINFDTAKINIPDNLNYTYFKSVNESTGEVLYFFIDKVDIVMVGSRQYTLKLDYYMTYCRPFLIHNKNNNQLIVERINAYNEQSNVEDFVHTQIKNNLKNDTLINIEEIILREEAQTFANGTLPISTAKLDIREFENTLRKFSYDLVNHKLAANDDFEFNLSYLLYFVFIKKEEATFPKYHLYPVFNYKTQPLTLNYRTRNKQTNNTLEDRSQFLYNCLTKTDNYSDSWNTEKYNLTDMVNKVRRGESNLYGQDGFLGVYYGPLFNQKDLTNENYDLKLQPFFYDNNLVHFDKMYLYAYYELDNFKGGLIKPEFINENWIKTFYTKPQFLFYKYKYFLQDFWGIEYISNGSYGSKGRFIVQFIDGFNVYWNIKNPNGINDSVYTFGPQLPTTTADYSKAVREAKVRFNDSLANVGTDLINNISNFATGKIGEGISGLLNTGNSQIKNYIQYNRANKSASNSANNITAVEQKKLIDHVNQLNNYDLLTTGPTANVLAYTPTEAEIARINSLYENNGFLVNANINIENHINKLKQNNINYLTIKLSPNNFLYNYRKFLPDLYKNIPSVTLDKIYNLLTTPLNIRLNNEI